VMGFGIALHEGAWVRVISLFAVIAAAGVAICYRRHRVAGMLILEIADRICRVQDGAVEAVPASAHDVFPQLA
jgi:signal transduction histidine kinase